VAPPAAKQGIPGAGPFCPTGIAEMILMAIAPHSALQVNESFPSGEPASEHPR
jgi:hypothetical protein